MGGMIGEREIRSNRARMKVVKRVSEILKDKSLIVYKRFLMKMANQYKPIMNTGVVLTEFTNK